MTRKAVERFLEREQDAIDQLEDLQDNTKQALQGFLREWMAANGKAWKAAGINVDAPTAEDLDRMTAISGDVFAYLLNQRIQKAVIAAQDIGASRL